MSELWRWSYFCNGKTLKGSHNDQVFRCGYSDVIMWIEKQVMDALKNAKVFNQVWKEGQSIEIILN